MKNQISLLKIGDTQKKTYTTALFQMQIKDNNCDKIPNIIVLTFQKVSRSIGKIISKWMNKTISYVLIKLEVNN